MVPAEKQLLLPANSAATVSLCLFQLCVCVCVPVQTPSNTENVSFLIIPLNLKSVGVEVESDDAH